MTHMTAAGTIVIALGLLAVPENPNHADSVTISDAKKDANGFLVSEVRSPYQARTTQIRVLLPEKLVPGKQLPVVYVLPVEAGTENHFGDGLLEIKKQNLHNQFPAIYVAPTFSHLPWYADHPTKDEIRQETYFLNVVLPFVEKTYPVKADASSRFLLGFSKSGWGAFSLILRHPDSFGKAIAWDAPLMMEQPNRYGMGDIFGTQENFEEYQVAKLLDSQGSRFQKEKRLLLLGYGNFRDHHEKAHALMNSKKIAHEYRDGPSRKHDWHSGWVSEGLEWLLTRPDDAVKK